MPKDADANVPSQTNWTYTNLFIYINQRNSVINVLLIKNPGAKRATAVQIKGFVIKNVHR